MAAIAGIPLAGIAGALPGWGALASAFGVGLLFAIIMDALLSRNQLEHVQAFLPKIIHLTKDRESGIAIHLRHSPSKTVRIQLGLDMPVPFETLQEEISVSFPANTEHLIVEWICTPRSRGRFELNAVYLEAASLFGFWTIRATKPVEAELRVYPNLFQDRQKLAGLFLNRGHFGIHAQRQIGKGREFEQLRDYIPGDSYEEISWKATAKRGRPITKVFQIERTQEIYVIIDASRLSARNAPDATSLRPSSQLERFLTAALILGLATEQQGDLFGLVVFSDCIQQFVRARTGKTHFGLCRDALYQLEPGKASPDYGELASFLRTRLRRRSLLLFLANLDDPIAAEDFTRVAPLLTRQHLVLVDMPAPATIQPLFSHGGVKEEEDVYSALSGHMQWHALKQLEQILHREGASFFLVNNENLSVQLVTQYMNIKRRQSL